MIETKQQRAWSPNVELGAWVFVLALFLTLGFFGSTNLMFWMALLPAFSIGRLLIQRKSATPAN